MDLKEAKKTLNAYINAIDTFGTIDPRCCNNLYEPVKTILQELDNLQKENEKYISGELMTRNQAKHFEEINKKYYIHKDKIREKIEERKQWLFSQDVSYKDDYVLEVLQGILKEE